METMKLIHVLCVALSICFFAGRGTIMFHDASFIGKRWVRRVAESIDSILFFTGVALAWLSEQLPWQDSWLGAKLLLLLLYILLGMIAFHWGRSQGVKVASWIAAIGTYLLMVAIALSRNPWPFEVDFF